MNPMPRSVFTGLCLTLSSLAIVAGCSTAPQKVQKTAEQNLIGAWDCQSKSQYQQMDINEQFQFTLGESLSDYQMLGTLNFSQANKAMALLDFNDNGSWDYQDESQTIALTSNETWSIKPRNPNFLSQLIASASEQLLQQSLNSVGHQLAFKIDWQSPSAITLNDITQYPSVDMRKQQPIQCHKH